MAVTLIPMLANFRFHLFRDYFVQWHLDRSVTSSKTCRADEGPSGSCWATLVYHASGLTIRLSGQGPRAPPFRR